MRRPRHAGLAFLEDPSTGARFNLERSPEGRLLAKGEVGSGAPAVIISIPKAGTYLLARVLESFGYLDVELHLSDFSLTDYRGMSVARKRGPDVRTRNIPVSVSAGLIAEGQFAVGHLKPEPLGRSSLTATKRIFLKRDLAEALFSHLRFFDATGRGPPDAPWRGLQPSPEQALLFVDQMGAQLFRDEYIPMTDWIDDREAFVVSFEELQGDFGARRRTARMGELRRFLGLEPRPGPAFDKAVLGASTKTWSGGRTDLSVYWSEEVRERLVALGLNELNARLGYPPR